LPVPPGFTVTTEVCSYFYKNGKTYPADLKAQLEAGLAEIGRLTGRTFGDTANPLLVSVRSGARASMPGMMDTVLNLGLNDATAQAIALQTGNERFAFDSYRRFITMYSDVVLGVSHDHFEEILGSYKEEHGLSLDTEVDAAAAQRVTVEAAGKPPRVFVPPVKHPAGVEPIRNHHRPVPIAIEMKDCPRPVEKPCEVGRQLLLTLYQEAGRHERLAVQFAEEQGDPSAIG
jgi:hypothetical protein